MTAEGLRLLQNLRRSLLDLSRQFRSRTVAATGDDEHPGNVGAIAWHLADDALAPGFDGAGLATGGKGHHGRPDIRAGGVMTVRIDATCG
jgi:hypothetical protein